MCFTNKYDVTFDFQLLHPFSVVDHGYVFDKKGDTCIKLLESDSDMSQGDTVCSKQNGRLLYLSGPGSRDIALDLMVRARGRPQFVWTGGGEPWDWKSGNYNEEEREKGGEGMGFFVWICKSMFYV